MRYISNFVKIPKEIEIKEIKKEGIALILDYVPEKLYEFEIYDNVRYFRPYIGKIQDILLIGIAWLHDEQIEADFLSDKSQYGIVIQIDYPKKGQITIIYKKFPEKEFLKIDKKKEILVEILLVEKSDNITAFWGSLQKSVYPERSVFDQKWSNILEILEKDYLTMGISAYMITNKLKIFNVKYL
jgi:hypothetical protein